MKDKTRNVLIVVSVCVILIIFIDLIFNFSRLFVENFDDFRSAGQEYSSLSNGNSSSGSSGNSSSGSSGNSSSGSNGNSSSGSSGNSSSGSNGRRLNDNNITQDTKSIVSNMYGIIINIKFLRNIDGNTIFIPSPSNQHANLMVNSNGDLGEGPTLSSRLSQQFVLVKINSSGDYNRELETYKNNGKKIDADCTNYPFYIIKPKDVAFKNLVLSYEPGKLVLAPKGNYENQKWNISNINNTNVSVCRRESKDSNQIDDPNKIKIKLNLTDEIKKQLFSN